MSYPSPGLVNCPYCKFPCECDVVDIGIGYQQCGPYFCENCQASQIGPYDNNTATDEEKRVGWYAPGRPISTSANTYDGMLVSHQIAKTLYLRGMLDPKLEPKE